MDILDPAAHARINVTSYGVSDVGLERKNNEDAFHIDEAAGLYVVCDGMGGHAAGELASQLTVDTMSHFVTQTLLGPGFRWPYNSPTATTVETRVLDNAVRIANRAVHDAAGEDPTHKGMGTTIVGMLVGPHQIGIVHVGDSRIYRLRGNKIEQLTDDHSLLNHYIKTRGLTDEQIRTFKGKNVIVRAIGLRDVVQPEVQVIDVQAGDVWLLCSDGLTDLVSDDLIQAQMAVGRTSLKDGSDQLIRAALARGGRDNVTIVMVGVGDSAIGGARDPAGADDTSPGFDAIRVDGAWDQETLPAFESTLAAEPPVDTAASVDGDTPKATPAVRIPVARATPSTPAALFISSPDSKGSPIPPPPRSQTAKTEPQALPRRLQALPGSIPPPPAGQGRATGLDSRGAVIPLPPGHSTLSVPRGVPTPPTPPAADRRPAPARPHHIPASESPFARAEPATPRAEPSAAAQPQPGAPPPLPTAAPTGVPAGDIGKSSAPVGPATAAAPQSGMATAPYLAIVIPPDSPNAPSPVLTAPPDAPPGDLFTAPTVPTAPPIMPRRRPAVAEPEAPDPGTPPDLPDRHNEP